jgi:hypothetical protein
VDHGAHFKGSLNLFGGYDEKLDRRIRNALKADVVWSLGIDMPDYAKMLSSRKDAPLDIIEPLRKWQAKAKTIRPTDLEFDWVAVGDSHTMAVAPHKSMVVRENGKTLFGQVRDDFPFVRETLGACKNLRGITLCFGSVDLRHHICRVETDWKEIYRALKSFGDSLDIEVEYALPFPVEFEGRKLPKSGWYKGQPFWGSQKERSGILTAMWDFAEEIELHTVSYPKNWLQLDPEEYAQTRMEKPQSVHLSPTHYRRRNWGEE